MEGLDAADGHGAGLGLQAAVKDDKAQGQGADDLHGRQEQRRKPGRPVAGAVHFAGFR
jgi:hypothetical protein